MMLINRKTINRYHNIFRNVIELNQKSEFQKFIGKIELDELYFGARRTRRYHEKLKRGRGTMKQPVFGIFERNSKFIRRLCQIARKRR